MAHIVRFYERLESIQLGLLCIVHGNDRFENNYTAFSVVPIRRLSVTVRVICDLFIRPLMHI